MGLCIETGDKRVSYINSFLFTFFLSFYWVGKSPDNFFGFYLLDFSTLYFLLLSVAQIIRLVRRSYIVKKVDLLFPMFLVFVPVLGIFGSLLSFQVSTDWSAYVDETLLSSDTLYGFRSPVVLATLFLFASPVVANYLTKSQFIAALAISSSVHLIWGVGQFLYGYFPGYLERLPILVGAHVDQSFNLIVFRASGLMLNAFPFAWFYLIVSLSWYIVLNKPFFPFLQWLFSFLALSRAFMFFSLPYGLYLMVKLGRKKIILLLSVFILLVGLSYDHLYDILENRFSSDVSVESRTSTNLLVFDDFLNGNFFGIGYGHAYFTDSSYSYHLLSAGIFGLASYICAWVCFFYFLYKNTSGSIAVALFSLTFFVASALVGTVEAQPGVFILFVLYWMCVPRRVVEHANIK